jgi:hypothetical protein
MPGPNFEDIGKKIESVSSGAERLESILMSEYYDIVKKEKLYDKEHVFTDDLKGKLVDNITNALKEQILFTNPLYKNIDPKTFDDIFTNYIMEPVFGMTKSKLQEALKDKKRITKEDIGRVVGNINNTYAQTMMEKAVADINSENVVAAKDYLKTVSSQYKLPFHEENLRESRDVKNAILGVHNQLYHKKMEEKYI